MRLRFTLGFLLLTLVIAGTFGVIRAAALNDLARVTELDHLAHHAQMIGSVVEVLRAEGAAVGAERLAAYVPPNSEASVWQPGDELLVVPGEDFDRGQVASSEDAIFVRETVGDTTVSLIAEDGVVVAHVDRQQRSLLALLLFVVLLTSAVGFAVSTVLARPFRKLARAAADLGRGRFDIDPPASRIPEVASISASLRASAGRLQDALHRDREFFHHASHVLRTPLTGIRLELDNLMADHDLDEETRHSVERCLHDAQRLDATVAEMLHFARGRALVAGAEVSLLDFSTQVAQRWRDRLPDSRVVKAYVEDGPDCTLTPGPVEQLLDSVLSEVRADSVGPVTMHFSGDEDVIKMAVECEPRPGRSAPSEPGLTVAGSIIEALGGRSTGSVAAGQVEILLPRR